MELLATTAVLERLVSVVITSGLLVAGYRELVGFLVADVIGRAIGLAYASRRPVGCRGAAAALRRGPEGGARVVPRRHPPSTSRHIAGTVRSPPWAGSRQRGFGIEVFGQVALAFSLVNIVLTLVTPISSAVLPSIRRQGPDRLPDLYARGLDLLMPLLVVSLVAYVPMAGRSGGGCPPTRCCPAYLGAMLPMIVFESRTRLFAIPFLQALRRERGARGRQRRVPDPRRRPAWFSVGVVGSALATVLSVTVSVVVRSFVLEVVASRVLGLHRRPRTLMELGVSVLFVVATGSHVGRAAWVAFALAWVGYLWWCRSLLGALLTRLSSQRGGAKGRPAPRSCKHTIGTQRRDGCGFSLCPTPRNRYGPCCGGLPAPCMPPRSSSSVWQHGVR